MTIHRRLDEAAPVHEPDNELVLRSLLATSDTDADLSITWVQLAGHHRRLLTDRSTRIYLVLSGSGSIQIGDEPMRSLVAGDTVAIAPGTPYELDGPMTYLVLNQPGFREGDDVYVEPGEPGEPGEGR